MVNVATASTTVAIMLGLSCGIDYGLFVLYRHRNHVLRGMDPETPSPSRSGPRAAPSSSPPSP